MPAPPWSSRSRPRRRPLTARCRTLRKTRRISRKRFFSAFCRRWNAGDREIRAGQRLRHDCRHLEPAGRKARCCGTTRGSTSPELWSISITRSPACPLRLRLEERQPSPRLRSQRLPSQLLRRQTHHPSSFSRHRVCRKSSQRPRYRAAFFLCCSQSCAARFGVLSSNRFQHRRTPCLTTHSIRHGMNVRAED